MPDLETLGTRLNPRALHILHLSTAKTWRGGENQLFLLARASLTHGHKSVVVAPPGSPLIERCRSAGIECRELKINLLGAWKLAKVLRDLRPDILHAHDGHAVLPAKLALTLAGDAGKKTKLIAHRRTVFKINGRSKYQGRVDRVIAISHAAKNTLLDAGVPAVKIRVVYSGMDFPDSLAVDSAEANAFRASCSLPGDAFVIAHAAALTAEKRQHDMLQALFETHERLNKLGVPREHLPYLVIAGSGELDAKLRENARLLGLKKHVAFAGFLTDLRPLWAVSKLAFFASEAEGLCTALIEAQGAGLPAVVTRAGGMAEVVEDGASGVIVEIGKVSQMAEALTELVQDPLRRQRLAENARVRSRGLFSSEAMAAGVLSVYTEVVGE